MKLPKTLRARNNPQDAFQSKSITYLPFSKPCLVFNASGSPQADKVGSLNYLKGERSVLQVTATLLLKESEKIRIKGTKNLAFLLSAAAPQREAVESD